MFNVLVATNYYLSKELSQSFSYLIFIILIAFLAYISTKFIAKTYLNISKTNNIEIIERHYLNKEIFICLIKLADNYYFAYADKNKFNIIEKVDIKDLKLNNKLPKKEEKNV